MSRCERFNLSEDVNPNFDFVDDQISDMHEEVIDTLLEDDELMGGMLNIMGADTTTVGMAGGSSNTTVAGMGSTSAAGSSRR